MNARGSAEESADLRFWLALHRAPQVGSLRFRQLLERFGTPEAVFAAGRPAWREAGMPGKTCDYLAAPDWAAVEADLRWLSADPECRHCLTLDHPDYPEALRAIDDPPPVLYVTGRAAALSANHIAMVGSRSPSPSGVRAAREFARELAEAGVGIVSGLAVGIDAASHAGALEGRGVTVAVAGTGPDRIYPRYHAQLAEDIQTSGGALVSEYPPGTGPLAANFPRRNRIISGLSRGVLVVEAALRSGSLITARLALEQGRDVFAVPGSIYSPMARGCNALIQQGAKLIQESRDILEEYDGLFAPGLDRVARPDVDGRLPEDGLLKYIAYDPVSVDTLVSLTGKTADQILTELLDFELRGFVGSLPGGLYVRIR